jgi:tetratricopeptide (TPR) repeat protein
VEPVHARAHLLYGNILAEKGEFKEASNHFEQAASLVNGKRLQAVALGRKADMAYSVGTDEALQQALDIFSQLANNEQVPADLREMASYKLGKTCEKKGLLQAALDIYLEIFYDHQYELSEGKAERWYFFARSGYDAARLILKLAETSSKGKQGDNEDARVAAARIYERLMQSGIPTAHEARGRMESLRKDKKGEENNSQTDQL